MTVLIGIGWFVVMNILQPRLMAGAVGLHPIVVLGSVLVGGKIAGVAGAIFGIPIAAIVTAFFWHYLEEQTGETDRPAGRPPGRAPRGPAGPGAHRAPAGDRPRRRGRGAQRRRFFQSLRISRAAFWPGRPVIPPPGWAPDPARYRPSTGSR